MAENVHLCKKLNYKSATASAGAMERLMLRKNDTLFAAGCKYIAKFVKKNTLSYSLKEIKDNHHGI